MLKKVALLAMGIVMTTSVQANADLFKPEDLVKYRQSIYQVMSAQTKVIGAMTKGEIEFDAKEVHQRSVNMANAAKLLPETYDVKTKGVSESNMLVKAWDDMPGVGKKGTDFGKALENLVAKSSEPGFSAKDSRKAFGAVAKTCKACHDDYRK